MNTIYIYTLSHPITNEVRYVGKTINVKRRYKQHLYDKRGSHKASWVKSLKSEGLKPILTIIENCTPENWVEREMYWIKQFDNLTNLKAGGNDSFQRTTTEQTKQKISLANKGKEKTSEHKIKISLSSKGKILSQETKDKMKISQSKKSISIDSKVYDSINDATRKTNIPKTTIINRLKSEYFTNYFYL